MTNEELDAEILRREKEKADNVIDLSTISRPSSATILLALHFAGEYERDFRYVAR